VVFYVHVNIINLTSELFKNDCFCTYCALQDDYITTKLHKLSRLQKSNVNACYWHHSTFIKWTGWTLAMALPWWQHHKHCRGYYYYYYCRPI